MQPLNDAQLAEHTAILGKVKLDKGLDYETIGKMLIASVLRRNEKSIDAQKPDVQGRVSIASRSGTRSKFHTEDQGVRVVCCVCELTQPGDIIICRGKCCF